MKKIALLMVLVTLMVFVLSSCGSFFAESEMKISAITSEALADGSTKIIISYTDENLKPSEFIIPQGKEGQTGKDGNGIREISYKYNKDNSKTEILIDFTDVTRPPVSFSVPDGVSVVGITDGYDSVQDENFLVFNYSNGMTSDPVYLPRGKDGADGEDGAPGKDGANGVGIKNYTAITNEDKSVYVCFELDDGRICEIDISAPEKGNGIVSMVSRTDVDGYHIDVTYDDGTVETLEFERPTRWLRGNNPPTEAVAGIIGDYYFDTVNKIIYIRSLNSWEKIVDFTESKSTCKVTFDLNAEGDAFMYGDTIFSIEKGYYFSSYGYDIPIPTRAGYEFLGWYTVRTSNPNPTQGAFTNLTPVMSDLTLYAVWKPISE